MVNRLLSSLSVTSAMPTALKFQISLLSLGGWGWVGVWGWVGNIEIKANSAQLELELGMSLAKYTGIVSPGAISTYMMKKSTSSFNKKPF